MVYGRQITRSAMFRPLASLCISLGLLAVAAAAPHLPTSDQQVLERLPSRAAQPRAQAMAAARSALAKDPRNLELAVALVRRYLDEVSAEGDPRYIGYAQAALSPWWALAEPPVVVRVLRAILRQFNHDFDAAMADLRAATAQDPGLGEAWAWQAAIAMVQARYDDARAACGQLAASSSKLIATACTAYADSATGQAQAAASALAAALKAAPSDGTGHPAAEQLWALTRWAEIEDRRGQWPMAETLYRRALALGLPDTYLLAAYADFLLDRGRPAEVLALLKDKGRADVLLLRLALAAKASQAAGLASWTRELSARFDAARLRADSAHEKEEARFAQVLLGDAARALKLAQANYAVQREPADARVLLEAALAARSRQAAEPALQWLLSSRIESVPLQALAAQLKALP